MKWFIHIPITLTLLTACQSQLPRQPEIVIAGTVQQSTHLTLLTPNTYETIPVKSNQFSHTLHQGTEGYYTLSGEITCMLYLKPGDSIHISQQKNRLVITGNAKKLNRKLQHLLHREHEMIQEINITKLSQLPHTRLNNSLQQIMQQGQKNIQRYFSAKKSPSHFLDAEKQRQRYLTGAIVWDIIYFLTNQGQPPNKAFIKQLHNWLNLPLDNSVLLATAAYQRYVTKKITFLSTQNQITQELNGIGHRQAGFIADSIQNPQVRNHFLYQLLQRQLNNFGLRHNESIIRLFRSGNPDALYLRNLASEINWRKQWSLAPDTIIPYKTIHNAHLTAHIFLPITQSTPNQIPAILLFHGGGWCMGMPQWSYQSCEFFRSLGMAAIAIEYRLHHRDGSSPADSFEDAQDALGWITSHATQYNIDQKNIGAGGWSAGGHLATLLALTNNSSSAPAFVINWSAIYNVVDGDYGRWFSSIMPTGYDLKKLSPTTHVRAVKSPFLMLHTTHDTTSAYPIALNFAQSMNRAGNDCRLIAYPNGGHLFFNDKAMIIPLRQDITRFLMQYNIIDQHQLAMEY